MKKGKERKRRKKKARDMTDFGLCGEKLSKKEEEKEEEKRWHWENYTATPQQIVDQSAETRFFSDHKGVFNERFLMIN